MDKQTAIKHIDQLLAELLVEKPALQREVIRQFAQQCMEVVKADDVKDAEVVGKVAKAK